MARLWEDIDDPDAIEWAVQQRLADPPMPYESIAAQLDISNIETMARKLRNRVRQERIRRGEIRIVDLARMDDEELSLLENQIIAILLRGPCGLPALCDQVDRGRPAVQEALKRLRESGYAVRECEGAEDREVSLPRIPDHTGVVIPPIFEERASRVIWASISDTHFGSRYVQKTALLHFLDMAYERYGVRHVFHSGDVTAGERVYKGQTYDLYAHGADEQIDDAVNSLPRREGLRYYMLGGNHDASFIRLCGLDVVMRMCAERDDFIFCGWAAGDIRLTDRASLRLWHPSGGMPYAISYRGQRYAAQIAFEELNAIISEGGPLPANVRILQIGHLHVMGGPIDQGALDFYHAGCFEGQTTYLREKGLIPTIGAYIVEAEITESGILREITTRRFRYEEMADDWKGYSAPRRNAAVERAEPLFKIGGGEI